MKATTQQYQLAQLNLHSHKPIQHTHTGSGRIRGHSQLQGEHEAFEEVFRQLWDLFWKDLTDEGDELVVLVTQRGELEKNEDEHEHN